MKSKRRGLKIVIISFFIFVIVARITYGYAFADQDVATLLNEWYSKKVTIAYSMIDSAVEPELATQKLRVEEAIREKMETASNELDDFTRTEIEKRKNTIIEYADQLIMNMDISNDSDKSQIESILNEILNSAIAAMEELDKSYAPTVPIEIIQPEQTSKETNPEGGIVEDEILIDHELEDKTSEDKKAEDEILEDDFLEDEVIIEEELTTEDNAVTNDEATSEDKVLMDDEATTEDKALMDDEATAEDKAITNNEATIENKTIANDEIILEDKEICEGEVIIVDNDFPLVSD